MIKSLNRPSRILMIAYSYYESDARVIREAEAAVAGGFEVDFLALHKAGTSQTEVIRGVRVIRLRQSKYRGGGYVRYILSYLEFFMRCFVKATIAFLRRRYDIVHVNNMPDFLVFSTVILKLCGAKIILDIHDPMPNTFASKFKGREKGFYYEILRWQERLSAAYCNLVLTVHHPVRDGILVKHGLSSDSIEVIANFADSNLFPLRKSFDITDRIGFAFHGTILERSGLGILVTALANVRRKDRIFVKIIGEGDFSQRLSQMIDLLSLGKFVEFDNRSYSTHSISKRIEDCHVGLVPLEISSITNYALPLKLLEYMSLGLPVVSVRNEAISYYFDSGDCMFYEWDNADSLTALLDRILEDPAILLRYRERSIQLREKFSWESEKGKYIALLRKLVEVSVTPNSLKS